MFIIGLDPLSDAVGADDINSVAGLLKMYFRELKEPIFPLAMFDELIRCSQSFNSDSKAETDTFVNVYRNNYINR